MKRSAYLSRWYGLPSLRQREGLLEVKANDGIFRIAKQMSRERQDVVSLARNDKGKLALTEEKMAAWVEHYSRLLNVEFEWPSDASRGRESSSQCVLKADSQGACQDAVWQGCRSSGIVADMPRLLARRELLSRQLAVFSSGVIPSDWEESIILNLFKGKGEDSITATTAASSSLTRHEAPGARPGLQDPEDGQHDEMQYGFVPGRGTTDAIFVARQLQEKYIADRSTLLSWTLRKRLTACQACYGGH